MEGLQMSKPPDETWLVPSSDGWVQTWTGFAKENGGVKYVPEDSIRSLLCSKHKEDYELFHVGGCLVCWLESESPLDLRIRGLIYRMALHIQNAEKLSIAMWRSETSKLLAELREVDPERYDKEVK